MKRVYRIMLDLNAISPFFVVYLIKEYKSIMIKDMDVSYFVYPLCVILFTGICLELSRFLPDEIISGGVKEVELADGSYLPSFLGYFFVALSVTDVKYKEATDEETVQFLQNDFIELENDYGVEKVKKSNRKRIAVAMETLRNFSPRDRKKILKYTHDYYPELKYEEKNNVFTIGNEEEMKYLLWGIEQRYYTTPVTKERRVANSVIPLQ